MYRVQLLLSTVYYSISIYFAVCSYLCEEEWRGMGGWKGCGGGNIHTCLFLVAFLVGFSERGWRTL